MPLGVALLVLVPALAAAVPIRTTQVEGHPRSRTFNDTPAHAIDGNLSTWTWTTDPDTFANPGFLQVGFAQTNVNRLQSAEPVLASGLALPTQVEADTLTARYVVRSVALEGDTLVAGEPVRVIAPIPYGAFSIFERGEGAWLPTLQYDSSVAYADFGRHVALSSGRVAVGAPGRGYVTIFETIDGVWQATGGVASPEPRDRSLQFGDAVAIDGDLLVVGQPHKEWVYIYRRNATGSWDVLQVLQGAPNVPFVSGIRFGSSVAVRGRTIMVGAPLEDSCGYRSRTGSVYIYEEVAGTWSFVRKEGLPCTAGGSRFGFRIALSDSVAVISAPYGSPGKGTAFVLEQAADGWSPPIKLNDGGASFIGYGESVAVSETVALVGAPEYIPGKGGVFVYLKTAAGWVPDRVLVDGSATASTNLGYSVAISGNTVAVGGDTAQINLYELPLP